MLEYTLNVKYVLEEILELKFDYMIHGEYYSCSYIEHYRFGDVFILVTADIQKVVLLEFKL